MKALFKSTTDRLDPYNGPVTIIRPLTNDEADISEVGPMFKVKAPDGTEFDVFEDEITIV